MRHLASLVALTVVSCGGDSPAPSPTPGPGSSPPRGLYLGYYMEDRGTNPEDPTPGALYLNLPANDSAFTGSMFFTYVGCQTSNIGTVSGTKRGQSLSGTGSGAIDNVARSGGFTGTYDAAQRFCGGTYTVSGGKQFMSVPGCIQYFIAPNGTWELFVAEEHVPASFAPSVSGFTASWATVVCLDASFRRVPVGSRRFVA